MTDELQFIRDLVAKGGPEPCDYAHLDRLICEVYHSLQEDELSDAQLAEIRSAFGHSLTQETMQGFALEKPHGYAGDFEIIDRIYRCEINSDPSLSRWDVYYHQHAAPKAVRNRKTYFHRVLELHCTPSIPLGPTHR